MMSSFQYNEALKHRTIRYLQFVAATHGRLQNESSFQRGLQNKPRQACLHDVHRCEKGKTVCPIRLLSVQYYACANLSVACIGGAIRSEVFIKEHVSHNLAGIMLAAVT